MTLSHLPQEFRAKAADVRMNAAAEQAAYVWERAADLLEAALRGHMDESLTLAEAEFESGYTRRHLKRLVREGKLPIRADGTVLRRDLPRKPGSTVASDLPEVSSSRVQLARAVADGG